MHAGVLAAVLQSFTTSSLLPSCFGDLGDIAELGGVITGGETTAEACCSWIIQGGRLGLDEERSRKRSHSIPLRKSRSGGAASLRGGGGRVYFY